VVLGFMTSCSLVVCADVSKIYTGLPVILFNLEDGGIVGPKCYDVRRFCKCASTFQVSILSPSRNYFDLKMKPLCSSKASYPHEMSHVCTKVFYKHRPACFLFGVEINSTLKMEAMSSSKCWYPLTRLRIQCIVPWGHRIHSYCSLPYDRSITYSTASFQQRAN
jgi:hypothetical protein